MSGALHLEKIEPGPTLVKIVVPVILITTRPKARHD